MTRHKQNNISKNESTPQQSPLHDNNNIFVAPSISALIYDGSLFVYNGFKSVLSTAYTYRKHILLNALLFGPATSILSKLTQVNQASPVVTFEPIAGNLSTARSVFVGEIHTFRNVTNIEVDLITKNIFSHFVLLEGVPNNIEVDCSSHGLSIQPGRKCIGWEDPELLQSELKEIKYSERGRLLRDIKKLLKKNHTSEEIDQALEIAFNKAKEAAENELNKTGLTKFSELYKNYNEAEHGAKRAYYVYDYLSKLTKMRAAGKNYKFIFEQEKKYFSYYTSTELDQIESKNCTNPIAIKARKNYQKGMLDRNKAMLNSVSRYPGLFAVTISGNAHVEPTVIPSPTCDDLDLTEAAKYVQNELAKPSENQNYYAVLAMRVGHR